MIFTQDYNTSLRFADSRAVRMPDGLNIAGFDDLIRPELAHLFSVQLQRLLVGRDNHQFNAVPDTLTEKMPNGCSNGRVGIRRDKDHGEKRFVHFSHMISQPMTGSC